MSRGGVAKQSVFSYRFVCLMLAPLGLLDLEGIFTGVRIFACVISLKTNKKARTKPLLVYGII